jgi:hypothetical protein
MVTAVMHARYALHLNCCYEPVFSYISRSTVIQNSSLPILLRSWSRLLVRTVIESMMAEVAHFNSVVQHITAASKNSNDFECIRCTGCSLHHQQIIDGIVRGLTRIYIPWWCRREIG